MMPKKKFFITTAIPYVNAPPHIGHALEFVQTDVIARWHRLKGDDVFFLSGSDENAQKNVLAAAEKNVDVKLLVEKNSDLFKELLKTLNISNDDFIRTSVDKKHSAGAIKIWKACEKSEDIYKKSYSGLYCIGCEAFITEKELVDGKCAEHLKTPEIVSEENYFFRLSKYQKLLKELISSDKLKIVPESRKNEMLSFIDAGLADFSVSRPAERMKGWGIPVPDDKSQIIYVWFDALTNYITALGFANNSQMFKKFWPADVHVIGKGITRFHAIYWPAMLLSAKVAMPKSLFVHGYITVNGQKISKSLGNVIDPVEIVKKYGADSVRYFLLRHISPFNDGDFSESALVKSSNADLADGLGNLLQRTCVMVHKYFSGVIPKPVKFTDKEHALIKAVSIFDDVDKLMNNFEWNRALERIFESVHRCNKYVTETEPWKISDKKRLATVLYVLIESLRIFSILLSPFIPFSAEKISAQLGQKHCAFKNI
ncbi:methionine--tRNA ligase, partial [Candidatus Woesearchaeota archaeon]|nr:methionine--tRNA ligase [Candidatus Woesearchaeota archaeon]